MGSSGPAVVYSTPWQVVIRPKIIACFPLLGGENLDKPPNPLIVNSVRLFPPILDLHTWRERAAVAKTAKTGRFEWSEKNKILREKEEGEDVKVSPQDVVHQSSHSWSKPRSSNARSHRRSHSDGGHRRRRSYSSVSSSSSTSSKEQSYADTTYSAQLMRGLCEHSTHTIAQLKKMDPNSLSERQMIVLAMAYDDESRGKIPVDEYDF